MKNNNNNNNTRNNVSRHAILWIVRSLHHMTKGYTVALDDAGARYFSRKIVRDYEEGKFESDALFRLYRALEKARDIPEYPYIVVFAENPNNVHTIGAKDRAMAVDLYNSIHGIDGIQWVYYYHIRRTRL